MKYIILLLTVLFSLQSYAADDGDWWLQRNVSIGDGQNEYRRINVTSRTSYDAPITKDGITKMERLFKNVVVEDVPSKVKVGKPLLERAKAFKGGLAGVLGGAAITALIESVGWLIEDGTYVKYKVIQEDQGPIDDKDYGTTFTGITKWYSTKQEAIKSGVPWINQNVTNIDTTKTSCTNPTGNVIECHILRKNIDTTPSLYIRDSLVTRPKEIPLKEPTKEKFTITPEQVGGLVTGDYKDPVDPNLDITHKRYAGPITDAYQHDLTGIGNEISNEIDDRIKNAPPTSDGKPGPIGDSRYSTAPQTDTTTNDRSWTEETDTTGQGTTTPVTDPETGEATGQQSISFKFPEFCQWAFKVCDWYDDWKASDKLYKDHMTKTEEHQTQEKTFWQSVKDWFDWTKEPLDEEPDLQEEEPDTQGIFERTFDTSFSLSNECPPDIPFTLETYFLSGSWNISTRWLCIIFTFLGYPLVFLSHCCGLWILYETVVHRQIKW